MAGIRVSKKHGVNPSLSTCAWCGKEKNEIVLMGQLKGDAEAPRNVIVNYEPCDECRTEWNRGVAVIEVVHAPLTEGQMGIAKGAYPTGRMVVVKETVFNGKHRSGEVLLAFQEDFSLMFGADL